MARTKQRKVGDRIFYEKYDGTIGTATIKKIEPVIDTYMDEAVKYNYYYIGVGAVIEDYSCLSDNDPRVKTFCEGKKFLTSDFADKLRKLLVEHGAQKGDYDVLQQILNDLTKEFE